MSYCNNFLLLPRIVNELYCILSGSILRNVIPRVFRKHRIKAALRLDYGGLGQN